MKDVEGLEELAHTDNFIVDEAWESAPELLSLLIPLKGAAQIERMTAMERGSRLAKYGRALAGEMAGDYVLWDPFAQALVGSGFKDEDFAANAGMNLVFNGMTSLFVKGEKPLSKALQDFVLPEESLKIGATVDELRLVNEGRIEEAQAKIASRLINGIEPEGMVDLRTVSDETVRGRFVKTVDAVKDSVTKAMNGEADAATNSMLSSILVRGKYLDDAGASQVTALSGMAKNLEGAIERGDLKASTLFNSLVVTDAAQKGIITGQDVADALKKAGRPQGGSEADAVAKERILAFASGTAPKPLEGTDEFQKAVLVRQRELTQTVIDEALVMTGKLPEGSRVHGVFKKLPTGEYLNVRTGTTHTPEAVKRFSQRYSVSDVRVNGFDDSVIRGFNNPDLTLKFEKEISVELADSTVMSLIKDARLDRLTVTEYRSFKMALKNAIVNDIVAIEGKVPNENNFNKHPVLSAWTKSGDNYRFDVTKFGFKPEQSADVQRRLTQAMVTTSPGKFVSDLKGLIGKSDIVKRPDEAVRETNLVLEGLPLDAATKVAVSSTVESAAQTVKAITEGQDLDEFANKLVSASLGLRLGEDAMAAAKYVDESFVDTTARKALPDHVNDGIVYGWRMLDDSIKEGKRVSTITHEGV